MRSSPIPMTRNYLETAIEIAQEAGKILVEEMSRPLDMHYKGDEVDIVTQADKRSEQAIVARLNKYFPDHSVAAEEGTGKENASEFRWHVDPLDGTTNFAHGYPCFCVSIALTQRSHGVRRDGSAALDLASVAAGRFDGFWEFGLQKWDTAAGVLLIEEAGGQVSDFAGDPYQLGGPIILATNGLIHEEMRAVALEISRRPPTPVRH